MVGDMIVLLGLADDEVLVLVVHLLQVVQLPLVIGLLGGGHGGGFQEREGQADNRGYGGGSGNN